METKIFDRDYYLSQMLSAATHSNILVVTGLRQVGKSTLVKELFLPKYTALNKIPDDNVLAENIAIWKKDERTLEHLQEILTSKIKDDSKYVIFLDEVQMLSGDYQDYLKTLVLTKNVLLCLSGSNSHGLSTDIADAFGNAAFSIPVFPLNYQEILAIFPEYPFNLYYNYGGLPMLVNLLRTKADDVSRRNYLDNILDRTYIRDIYEHDQSLKSLSHDNIKSVLSHFSSYLTTEISIRKTIQAICEDYQKSRKRLLNYEDKNDINLAFTNLVSDYEKSYLAYIFEEDKRDLINDEPAPYREQRKLYIADQGLLHQLSLGSDKLNENLLENLVYLELKHAGLKPRGLDLTYNQDGVLKNGQVDFVCQNDKGTNIYIQVVYNFTDINYDRETNSLLALPEGNKFVVYYENRLLARTLPSNIVALSIIDFCKHLEDYCNK